MRRRKFQPLVMVLLLAVLAVFGLAACGDDDDNGGGGGGGGQNQAASDQPGKGKPPVTLGTKDFTEEFVLGEL